jgi:TctA family transporter
VFAIAGAYGPNQSMTDVAIMLIFGQDWTKFFARPIVVALFVVTATGVLFPLVVRAVRASIRSRTWGNPIDE